jgi:photosystem I subunit 3
MQAALPEEAQVVESLYTEAPQASFNWAPVAALIALPTAIAAFLLRRSESEIKLATAGVAASAVLASGALAPMPANAAEGIFGLTPCAESKKFQGRLTKEIKAIEKREKLYEAGSAPYQALEATKARTEARFAKYAKDGLLCGDDGLPHLISDPGLAVRYGHAGETLIPTVGFLYVAGYIGHAGREYLKEISSRQKPTQSEIVIDVPLATKIAFQSWDWPGKAISELASGKLTEDDSRVPVSRR